MRRLLAEADRAPERGPETFYSPTLGRKLPPRFFEDLRRAQRLARELETGIQAEQFSTPDEHLDALMRARAKPAHGHDSIESALIELRPLLHSPLFTDPRTRGLVTDDLVRHFSKLTGVSLGSLTPSERAAFASLLTIGAKR